MKKILGLGLFIILIYLTGALTTFPSGYATYNEWLECTGRQDTEANYKYFLSEVEKLDF